MQVHSLKVRRKLVGRKWPWDKIYLVHYADRASVKTMWNYSIVMPCMGVMLETLRKLPVERRVEHPHYRTNEPGNTVLYGKPPELDVLLDLSTNQWLVVVPLLPKTQKKDAPDNARHPRYITSSRWMTRENTLRVRSRRARKAMAAATANFSDLDHGDTFNEQAYLHTPERDIRPPCQICPKCIAHMNGECHLGDMACYENLPIGIHAAIENVEDENDEQLPLHGT